MSSHHMKKIIFLLLLMFTECIRSLKLLRLHVPRHVPVGGRAHLMCHWGLGPTEELYSVKWYKDGKEFFRHVPANQEPLQKFKLPGVDVEDTNISGSNLSLSPASVETAGRYRCEVSGEKPLFPTVSDHGDMKVIVLPNHGPVISGFHPRYKIGEKVEVKCTSGQSRPATGLAWYINGDPAPVNTVSQPEYNNISGGHEITSLKLNFMVSEKDFIDNRLKIKCLATLLQFYWRSNEESALKQRSLDYREYDLKAEETITIKDPIIVKERRASNSGQELVSISPLTVTHGALMSLIINKLVH